MAVVALLYAGWRGWDTWPAVDRHSDRRADAYLAQLAEGVDAQNGLLVSKMDWQLENVLLYSSRYDRRNLAWVRLDDVLPHFPFLVRDNLAESRDVVLKIRDQTHTYKGLPYLSHVALPNFFFHATTAYDILRLKGSPA